MRIIFVLTTMCLFVALLPGAGYSAALNAEMTKFVQGLEAQAKKEEGSFKGFEPSRGKTIFFEERANDKAGKISCSTCHTADLKKAGKTLVGKVIDPLAPSVNKSRLSSVREVEKWLLRNFKQVYGREGTAREKGDVLMFINAQ